MAKKDNIQAKMNALIDSSPEQAQTPDTQSKMNALLDSHGPTTSPSEEPVAQVVQPKKTTIKPKAQEKANVALRFLAGAEQGLTPLVATAAKGAYGAGTAKDGALARTSGAIEGAFNPQNTLVAKYADKDFTPEGFDWANAAGNVAGEIAKVVGTGGVGVLDTLAKLGSRGAAKALSKDLAEQGVKRASRFEVAKGAVPYLAAKSAVGNVAGLAGGNAAAAVLPHTEWFQKLSPEEQQDALNVAATAGGLAAGMAAAPTGSYVAQRSRGVRELRDKAAGKIGLPTYNDINTAKKYNELSKIPGVNELMKDTGLSPQEVTNYMERAGVSVRDLSNDPAQLAKMSEKIHEDTKQLMKEASDLSFKVQNEIFDPEFSSQLISQEDLTHLRKQGKTYAAKHEAETGEMLPGEFTGVDIPVDKNGEYNAPYAEGIGRVKVKPTGEVELNVHKNNEDLIANPENTNKLFNNTMGAINQLNEIKDKSEGLTNARNTLTEGFAKQLDKLQEHKLGTPTITNWLRQHIMGENGEIDTQAAILDKLKTDGRYDSTKVVDYLKQHPDMLMTEGYNREGAPRHGDDLTGAILGHLKDTELSDKTLEQYASGMAKGQNTAEQQKAVKSQIQSDSDTVANNLDKRMSDLIYPVDATDTKNFAQNKAKQSEAVNDFHQSLSRAITEQEDLPGNPNYVGDLLSKSRDPKADIDQRINAAAQLGAIFSHTGKLLGTPKGAGFGKVEGAKVYRDMAGDIKTQLSQLHMEKWLNDHPGEQPTKLELAKIKKATDDAMNQTSVTIPSKVKGTEQNLSLLSGDKGSTPTRALVNMADTASQHMRQYGFNGAAGRDTLGSGAARLEEAKISNLPTSNMTYGDLLGLWHRLNKEKVYHKNTQDEYSKFTNQIHDILQSGIRRSKGDEAGLTYSATKNLQRAVLDLRDNHPELQKRILGGGDQNKNLGNFGTTPDFGERIADIAQSNKELSERTGKDTSDFMDRAKGILNASKTRMLVSGPEGQKALSETLKRPAVTGEGRLGWAGEHYKTSSWEDVLAKVQPELRSLGGGSVSDPLRGQSIGKHILDNPKAAKPFLDKLGAALDPDNTSYSKSAVENMTHEFVSDVRTGITDHVHDTIKNAMETGNLVSAMDKLQSFGDNVKQLTDSSDLLRDAFKQYPLGEVMRAVKEQNNDKAVTQFMQDSVKSPNPVATLINKHQQLENVQERAIRQLSNDVDKTRLSPAQLKAEHLNLNEDEFDVQNFKKNSNIVRKLGNIAIGAASFGFVRKVLGGKADTHEITSPAQQRAAITKSFLEFATAPDNAKLIDGKTKKELIKDEFHKASATLENMQNNKWEHLKRQNRTLVQSAGGAAHRIISPARQYEAEYNADVDRDADLERSKRESYMLPGY